MSQDSALILPHLELNQETLQSESLKVYSNTSKSPNSILTKLGELPKDELNDLIERYAMDMKILGYEFNPVTLEAKCGIQTENGEICC